MLAGLLHRAPKAEHCRRMADASGSIVSVSMSTEFWAMGFKPWRSKAPHASAKQCIADPEAFCRGAETLPQPALQRLCFASSKSVQCTCEVRCQISLVAPFLPSAHPFQTADLCRRTWSTLETCKNMRVSNKLLSVPGGFHKRQIVSDSTATEGS